MNDPTKEIHRRAEELGERLGFLSTREVSDSILRLRLDDAYHPRIDLMWSLPLDEPKRRTLAWALGQETSNIEHLPVVGIEIEGTMPSTKIMAADAANLAALGAPIGLLIVSEGEVLKGGEKNIYARASRAIRTVRRSFGDLTVVPMEAGWLDDLISFDWPKGLSALAAQRESGDALDIIDVDFAVITSVRPTSTFAPIPPHDAVGFNQSQVLRSRHR